MKNIIIAILSLVCVVLVFKQTFKSDPAPPVEQEVKQLVDTEVKRVNKKIDQKGFEHAVIEEIENVVNNPKQLTDSVRKELDSVTQLLGIKEKQLRHFIQYSTTLKDSLLIATKSSDSTFTFSDKWTNITYVSSQDSASPGHFNFQYNAEINYTEYWRRKWLLGPKKHYIDFWLSDSRATINGVKRIKFEPTPARSRLRVNAVALYHDGFHAGGDGQIRIGSRYWIGGGYLYDFDEGLWKPMFTGKMNLVDW